ncbi:MAG: glycosyltransferase family 4 protein [Anaerolineae bacterium]|nr:glycosyltransferase family 4 protein [Anaerolineae bacterium]
MMNGIVMLVNEFHPLPVGGAERQAERLAEYLVAQGRPVWVITRRISGLPAHDIHLGTEIIRPLTFGPGKLKTISFVLGAIITLWKLRHKYKILHAHMLFGPAFAGVWIRRLLDKRILVKLGSSGETGEIRTSQNTIRGRWRLSLLQRWADALVTLDDGMKQEAISSGFNAEIIHSIPNGVDINLFSRNLSRPDAQFNLGLSGDIIILFVGRLVKEKSLPTLLSAFAMAVKKSSALQLVIVGDGPERASLEAQTSLLGISEQVCFAGHQDNVRDYLFAADIFVLPSITEGISNALLEAMSVGLACLATPVGGNAEVLDHGNSGILLPPKDVNAWEQALLKVGGDADLRNQLGKAARQRILNNYDFSIIGGRYEALYTHLLEASR